MGILVIRRKAVSRKKAPEVPKTPEPPRVPDFKASPAILLTEGQRIAVLVIGETATKMLEVELTLPDADGMLRRTGSRIVVAREAVTLAADLAVSDEKSLVREWEASADGFDAKYTTPVREGDKADGKIIDYQDVTISGYLSTFKDTTPADREGDYVMPGAFDKTLLAFKRNPVLLLDHRNSTSHLAGSFTKMGIDKAGLSFEASISNAPGLRDIRFLVAEKHLKSTSMGGLFFYDTDGRGIKEVNLFEGSLTPVPANQDALFNVRSLTAVTAAKCFRRFEESGKSLKTK